MYSDYVSQFLDKHGYSIIQAPASVSSHSLWSPTNILIHEQNKTIFISDSFVNDINQQVEDIYLKLGYTIRSIPLDRSFKKAKAGVRCSCLTIRS